MSPLANALGSTLPSLKRKIPPDDTAEGQRPNKIRLTLRLPPRTPIPPRPRPILPINRLSHNYHRISRSDDDNDDASTSETSSEGEEEDSSEGASSDDDEAMLDDFSSLLADDFPISIPNTLSRGDPLHRRLRGRGLGIAAGATSHPLSSALTFCQSSLPFYDTCEPPPDSEDEDEDFHNSMLRDMDQENGEEDEGLRLKSEEDLMVGFDMKEEDFAAIVLQELVHSSGNSTHSPEPGTPSAVQGGDIAQHQAGLIEETDHAYPNPNSNPIPLKTEEGVFSPMDLLSIHASSTDSPASLEVDEQSVSSPTPYLPYDPAASFDNPGGTAVEKLHQTPYTRRGSSILSVPPPTPWIKTEDENVMFERHLSPDSEQHGLQELISTDGAFLPTATGVESPLMSAIPISSIRPWENLHLQIGNDDLGHEYHLSNENPPLGSAGGDWASISKSAPGPESVSTDDVDFFTDDVLSENRIKASTSAPVLPQAVSSSSVSGRKPLRLSIGNSTTFHNISSAAAGHTRRHSHAAVLGGNARTTRDRRFSVISNTATAFSDWTSGTPEDPDAPLVTPSHTGWRTYQCWPAVKNGSSSTLAHDRIEEREGGEEEENKVPPLSLPPPPLPPPPAQSAVEERNAENAPITGVSEQEKATEELNRILSAPSFNQVLTKSLPPNHRISTLLLLGAFSRSFFYDMVLY